MTTLWSIEERIVDDVKKKGVLILKTFNDNNNKEKKKEEKETKLTKLHLSYSKSITFLNTDVDY